MNDPTLLHRFPAPKSNFFMMEDREERGIPDGFEETANNSLGGVSAEAAGASSNKVNEDVTTSGASSDPIKEINFEYQKFLKIMKENKTNTPT